MTNVQVKISTLPKYYNSKTIALLNCYEEAIIQKYLRLH